MTAATSSVISGRAGYDVLKAQFLNIDGDQANTVALPSGYGDCVLDWAGAEVGNIATMVANPELLGVGFQVADASLANMRDFAGVARWTKASSTALLARVQPEQGSCMWYANELLYLVFVEVDTNAAPTADLTVVAKVRRLREP